MLQRRRARAMPFVMCSLAAFAGTILVVPLALAWSPIPTAQDRCDQAFCRSKVPRRDFLENAVIAASSLIAWPMVATAEEQGVMSTSDVASLLHTVPTFTIVDKKGVPFMVVGEDAKVTGYFFTSYGEAERILRIAKASADKAIKQAKAEGKSDEEAGTNPWTMARISTVPLDSAVTLVSKSSASFGGGNYFRLAPSEQDIDDALALTGQDDLAEGKVPLFYYADFTIEVDGEKRSPLYFRKSELENAFRRANRGSNPPPVLVTELLAVLAEMVKPGGTDNDLKTLIFVPPKESERKRIDCEKAGGNEPSFFIGQRIIVL
jgi:hypothetical protein